MKRNSLFFAAAIITTLLSVSCEKMNEGDPGSAEAPIPGVFTIGEGKRVHFAPGNLQATYDGKKYVWGFASRQEEFIGEAAGNTTIDKQTKGAKVDLFGWSCGSKGNNFGITTSGEGNTYNSGLIEWGKNIGDGKTWRTPSLEELEYLINTRKINGKTGLGNTFVYATVNSVNGIIIFCDGYTGNTENLSSIPEGCLFLPAGGYRGGSYVFSSKEGLYWTSTDIDYMNSGFLYFSSSDIIFRYETQGNRHFGMAVRLVTDIPADGIR